MVITFSFVPYFFDGEDKCSAYCDFFVVAGELGGFQVTGQQVTCIGSEILSASSIDNNILDGCNSEQVGSLDSNITPNGTT